MFKGIGDVVYLLYVGLSAEPPSFLATSYRVVWKGCVDLPGAESVYFVPGKWKQFFRDHSLIAVSFLPDSLSRGILLVNSGPSRVPLVQVLFRLCGVGGYNVSYR